MATTSTAIEAAPDAPSASMQRRLRIVLGLGILVSTINFLDRSVLNIMAEPIKRELGFSDTQLGLLTGFAFALFYSLVGVPIARYVDRPTTNRPAVIGTCVALWSGMTMVCGFVTSYTQLLVARALVAVGESGSGPANMTLIDQYVTPSTRSRAFAIYGLGIPLGTLLGLMVGGLLVDLVGWRLTFVIVGAPGLLLGLIVWLCLHEPRTEAVQTDSAAAERPSLTENVLVIVRNPALLTLMAAASIGGLIVTGLPVWTGVYLIRVLGLSATQAGLTLGLLIGIGGGLGTYFGGVIADRIAKHEPGRALLVPYVGLLIGIPAAIAAFLSDDWRVFVAFYWITIVGAKLYFGPVYALLPRFVDRQHRATTLVVVVMMTNLIGGGLGPLLVGVGSDLLRPSFGVEGLRYALIAGHIFAVVPAFLYLKAKSLTPRDL